jgi:hypothetical protein
MHTYTDKHTGKVYAVSASTYGRKVTQYPAGTRVWFDGSATAKATSVVVFETQAQRTSWLRMMGFVA